MRSDQPGPDNVDDSQLLAAAVAADRAHSMFRPVPAAKPSSWLCRCGQLVHSEQGRVEHRVRAVLAAAGVELPAPAVVVDDVLPGDPDYPGQLEGL